MLNLKHTLCDNFDMIKDTLTELNENNDQMVCEKQLKFLLFDAYEVIFPDFFKKSVSPAKFVIAALNHKDDLLRELNRAHRLKVISIV